jgi:hypothetical protein
VTSVYRTRSYVQRRRVLLGLAGVALLLTGYGIGRWQDTPTPVVAAATPAASPGPGSSAASAAPETPPPSPTVYRTLQAEAATELVGIEAQETEDEGGGQNVGFIAAGDSMRFAGFDFGPVPATQLEVRVASDADGGQMAVHLDSLDSPAVGTLTVTPTGGWQKWRTDVVTLTPVTGEHTVFLTFSRPDDRDFVNLNWLAFQH